MRKLWLIVAVLTASALVNAAEVPASDADARLVSALGVGQVQGRDVLVHVTLSVANNANIPEQAEAALREQGARPFQRSDYVLLGPTWAGVGQNDPQVTQNYNGSGAPDGDFLAEMQAAQGVWNDVAALSFSYGEPTTRCGSLIQECPGAQVFDDFQDVGWNDLGRCGFFRCTLAVTWFGDADGDGFMDDADVAFNTRVSPWRTGCNEDFDFQTIAIHEFGHVAGLGHSNVGGAVMEAFYGGDHCWLHADDIAGLTEMYPADGGGGEELPSLTIDDVSVDEGDQGTTDFTFTVSLSSASSAEVTVAFQTDDGTAATVSGDYQEASGNLAISAGSTSGTITVTVTGDTEFEGDETFTVNLANANNATIAHAEGIGTIINDDDAPSDGLSITSIHPSAMQAGTPTDVIVCGTGMVVGASLTFENGNGQTPTASAEAVAAAGAPCSGTDTVMLTASVSAGSGGPPRNRVWDVRVTNPDGSTDVLPDGFTVNP